MTEPTTIEQRIAGAHHVRVHRSDGTGNTIHAVTRGSVAYAIEQGQDTGWIECYRGDTLVMMAYAHIVELEDCPTPTTT